MTIHERTLTMAVRMVKWFSSNEWKSELTQSKILPPDSGYPPRFDIYGIPPISIEGGWLFWSHVGAKGTS